MEVFMQLFTVNVNKAGFHKALDTEYLCLGIINNDQALIVGEGKNITTASIYECQFVGIIEPRQPVEKVNPEPEVKETKKVK
jgi:hypothetical protein